VNGIVSCNAFQTSPNASIHRGVDGWLFINRPFDFVGNTYTRSLDNLMRDYDSNAIPDLVEPFAEAVTDKGKEFYFVLAPTKVFIHPQYAYYGNFDAHYVYPAEYITAELNNRGIMSLDLTPAVRAAANETGRNLFF